MADYPTYEQLNLFYLGRELDGATGETTKLPLLYKNKYLTTHAAIIGMTGSGKTGLGIGLLEEAAIDGIPAIIIDPKGDMANLLLSFPNLDTNDFLPWVDEQAAMQKDVSREVLAQQTAENWKQGLAAWDQDKARIGRMREKADFAIYTPGSSAGRPVSILDSLDAPDAEVLADNETVTGLVNAVVSSLLGLLGIEADPLKSRQHILLSSLILYYWRKGESPDLETLIGAVVQPPFKKIGVFPLDIFYPQEKRMDLALQLNNILASPALSSWLSGESLQIDNFLYTDKGQPRISIFSIAHLNEAERMFFVTMLLGRLIGWMRRQQGTSGLRCLLYMDEIFGYFPANANPPAKKPMLLLLKQARAFGVGVVLSTQNPVDLDYKGLSNIGTWFIGRLQTRQDQDRLIAGMGGGSEKYTTPDLRSMLANLRARTFLMSSTHQDEPVLFETRWVLSYLKGPVTLSEIGKIESKQKESQSLEQGGGQHHDGGYQKADHGDRDTAASRRRRRYTEGQPLLDPDIEQLFVPPPIPLEVVLYGLSLVGTATVRIFNQKRGIDLVEDRALRIPLNEQFSVVRWADAAHFSFSFDDLSQTPVDGASFTPVAATLLERRDFRKEEQSFKDHLYHTEKLKLLQVKTLKLESGPGESMQSFRQRVTAALADKREVEVEKIAERYRKKQQQLEARLEKALVKVEKEKGDVKARGVDTVLSFGQAILGAILGRKRMTYSTASRSARGVRSAGRLMKEKEDVQRALDEVERLERELYHLSEELQQKIIDLTTRFAPDKFPVETFFLAPRRADIFNVRVCLLWEPQFVLEPPLNDQSF